MPCLRYPQARSVMAQTSLTRATARMGVCSFAVHDSFRAAELIRASADARSPVVVLKDVIMPRHIICKAMRWKS